MKQTWWIFERQSYPDGWLLFIHIFGGTIVLGWTKPPKRKPPIQEDAHVERSILDV